MKKSNKLTMQIDMLVRLQGIVTNEGICKETARIISSVESDNKLPYPTSAYSNEPSITFATVSLESLGRIILEKLGQVVNIIFDLFLRFYNYLTSFFKSDSEKNFKKQKDYYWKSKSFYDKAEKDYNRKEKERTDEQNALIQKQLKENLTEELSTAKERLNGNYTNLLMAIDEQKEKAMHLIIQPKMVSELNAHSTAIIDNVKEALGKYAAGQVQDFADARLKALAYFVMENFQKSAAASNGHISKASCNLIPLPKFIRTNEDFIFPYIYLRDCISVIRESSYTKAKIDYVDDKLLKNRSSINNVEEFSVLMQITFSKDDILKDHKDFQKVKRELLTMKRKITSKSIDQEYVGVYRKTVLEYLKNITTTVNYAILFRQTNKIMARSILKFINSETAYMIARGKLMNNA